MMRRSRQAWRWRWPLAAALAWMPVAGGHAAGVPASGAATTAAIAWRGPFLAGALELAGANETSGLAASRRTPGLLWSHNDSGGEPVLYAFDLKGKPRGTLRVAGVRNTDWEDLAAFTLDGRAYLLVADVGDNRANRTDCTLHIVPECAAEDLSLEREVVATPAWSLPVRYVDGPRDCEAVAVDAGEGAVYLISKRSTPAVVYRLPLRRPATGPVAAATPVARLTGIPQPTGWQRLLPLPAGSFGAYVTGMDFSPDGSRAVVLTYGTAWLFQRGAGDNWAAAFARRPAALPTSRLIQAEAVCFSAEGRAIFVSTEQARPPLLRYDEAR